MKITNKSKGLLTIFRVRSKPISLKPSESIIFSNDELLDNHKKVLEILNRKIKYDYDIETKEEDVAKQQEALANAGGGKIDLSYSILEGKPASSVDDIDDAVSKKHSHTNTDVLSKLTADKGELVFEGKPVDTKPLSIEKIKEETDKVYATKEELNAKPSIDPSLYLSTKDAESIYLKSTDFNTAKDELLPKTEFTKDKIVGLLGNVATEEYITNKVKEEVDKIKASLFLGTDLPAGDASTVDYWKPIVPGIYKASAVATNLHNSITSGYLIVLGDESGKVVYLMTPERNGEIFVYSQTGDKANGWSKLPEPTVS